MYYKNFSENKNHDVNENFKKKNQVWCVYFLTLILKKDKKL